jgi:N-acetylneuraminic acid mutarotase
MKTIYWKNFIPGLLIICVWACKKVDKATPEHHPSFSGFYPSQDTVGATVVIKGADFNTIASENEVKFNGVAATVLSATADSLLVKVPEGASTGKITLKTWGQSFQSGTEFTVLYIPSITSFLPLADTVGALVTIKGKNFGKTIAENSVFFSSSSTAYDASTRLKAEIISASESQLVVKVPARAKTSSIYVSAKNGGANTGIFCVIYPPVITSITPSLGGEGSIITFSGIDLWESQYGSYLVPFSIKFNGVAATQIEHPLYSTSIIKATVPAGASTGKISLTVGPYTWNSANDFTVGNWKWTKKADMQGGSFASISFSINGKGYFGLGRNSAFFFKDLWEYDATADKWTQKADMPSSSGKAGSSCFVINNKAYIIGGLNGNGNGYSKEVWEYDPSQNSWQKKADFPGNARIGYGFSIGDKGYFGLGSGFSDWWQYDPLTDSWTQKQAFSRLADDGAISFTANNKGYITGGGNGSQSNKEVWEYDPVLDKWNKKGDFPGAGRYYGIGFSLNNYGYLGLGKVTDTNYKADLWEYRPLEDKWVEKGDLPGGARENLVAFTINGKAYLGSGYSNTVNGNQTSTVIHRDFWEFFPR